jgi:hypothetical protein
MTQVGVGSCVGVFGDHKALFDAVTGTVAAHGEAAVFVVGRITNAAAASGCAAHPAACAGVVITQTAAAAGAAGTAAAGKWVLAHEIGHLLGLDHANDPASLMFDPPTAITVEIPRLSADERQTIEASPILHAAVPMLAPPALAEPARRRRTPARKGKRRARGRRGRKTMHRTPVSRRRLARKRATKATRRGSKRAIGATRRGSRARKRTRAAKGSRRRRKS